MVDQFVVAPNFQAGFKYIKADPKWIVLDQINPCALGTLKKSNAATVKILNVQFDPEWLHEVYSYLTESDGDFQVYIVEVE